MSFEWSDLLLVRDLLKAEIGQPAIVQEYKEALVRSCYNRLYYTAFKTVEDRIKHKHSIVYSSFESAWRQQNKKGGAHERLTGFCTSYNPGTAMHSIGSTLAKMKPLRTDCDYKKTIDCPSLIKTLSLYEIHVTDILSKAQQI